MFGRKSEANGGSQQILCPTGQLAAGSIWEARFPPAAEIVPAVQLLYPVGRIFSSPRASCTSAFPFVTRFRQSWSATSRLSTCLSPFAKRGFRSSRPPGAGLLLPPYRCFCAPPRRPFPPTLTSTTEKVYDSLAPFFSGFFPAPTNSSRVSTVPPSMTVKFSAARPRTAWKSNADRALKNERTALFTA